MNMQKVDLSGGAFFYVTAGQGEPVLLLHGLGSCSLDWQPQIEFLAKSFKVYALDLRGHGQSPRITAPLKMTDLAKDVIEFLDKMQIQSCSFVGLSMGGMVTFQTMALAPSRIKAAVLINTAPEVLVNTWTMRLQLGLRLFLVKVLGLPRFGKILGKKLFPEAHQESFRHALAERVAQNDLVSYLYAVQAIAGYSSFPEVAKAPMPKLILGADMDYTTSENKMEYTRRLLQAEFMEIKNSRHASPIDQAEWVNQQILNFLKAHLESNKAENYVH